MNPPKLKVKNLNAMERSILVKQKNRPKNMKQVSTKTLTEEEIKYESLKSTYDNNVAKLRDDKDLLDYMKVALIEAEQVWLNIQASMLTESYRSAPTEVKIELIQKDFKEFWKNFPIVARYMVCHDQYSMKAFKKLLISFEKSKESSKNKLREKGANEKMWIEGQANYVRFLWEDVQDNIYDQKESDEIWKNAVEALTSEFNQFREMHENVKKKIKSDETKNKKELLHELISRMKKGDQTLDGDANVEFINMMKDKIFKQRFNKTMKELVKNIPLVEGIESIGTNDIAKDEYDNDIKQSYFKKNYQKMDIDKFKM